MGTFFKAPIRLLHFPGVALAAMVAALILALATTSTKLFIASTGEAVLRQELAGAPANPPLSITLFNSFVNTTSLDDIDRRLQGIVSSNAPGLGHGLFTVLGGPVDVVRPGAAGRRVFSPAPERDSPATCVRSSGWRAVASG